MFARFIGKYYMVAQKTGTFLAGRIHVGNGFGTGVSLLATLENKTTFVTTHFLEINNWKQRVYCLSYYVK